MRNISAGLVIYKNNNKIYYNKDFITENEAKNYILIKLNEILNEEDKNKLIIRINANEDLDKIKIVAFQLKFHYNIKLIWTIYNHASNQVIK